MRIIQFVFLFWAMALIPGCAPKISRTAAAGNAVTSIRVMSYNLHHCNPPSKPGLIDIDAVAEAIRMQRPDIVALQEVDVNVQRSGKIDQASLLAQKLDMQVFFAKAIDHDGGDYGVAILSKYPLSAQMIHHLPMVAETNGEPRVLATAMVTLPDGSRIQFGSTHLDALRTDTNRILQAAAINRIAGGFQYPFIIAGDFNAEPGSKPIDIMDEQFTRTCSQCNFTIPVIDPDKTIDFIMYQKSNRLSVVSHEVIPERYASDHLPVVAVLELKP